MILNCIRDFIFFSLYNLKNIFFNFSSTHNKTSIHYYCFFIFKVIRKMENSKKNKSKSKKHKKIEETTAIYDHSNDDFSIIYVLSYRNIFLNYHFFNLYKRFEAKEKRSFFKN